MPDGPAAAGRRAAGREIPPWAWLWLPPLLIVVVYVLRLSLSPAGYARWIDNELGLVELGTVLLLVPAAVFGSRAWRARARLPRSWLGTWILAVTAASAWFALEELSWGQHLVGWRTPALFLEMNDQAETNFHNLSSWFDQKPRLALELWVLIGGILLPAWRGVAGIRYAPQDWRWWFWPTAVCAPAAALAVGVRIPERIKDLLGLPPFAVEIRYSELQEFYFALFLCLYLLSIRNRLKQEAEAAAAPP